MRHFDGGARLTRVHDRGKNFVGLCEAMGWERKRALKISLSLVLLLALCFAGWILKELHALPTDSLLHCAIRHDPIPRFLCRADLFALRKIDPAERNQDGDPLLRQVFHNVPSVPFDAPGDARAYALADWLIKQGASLDATDAKGMTLLMHAVVEFDITRIKFLRSRGANPAAMGGGEFAGLSAIQLADRISAANLKIARGLLSCDKEALTLKSPEGEGHEVDTILRYEHFRVLRHVAEATGQSSRWTDCQPRSPEEAERLMTQMAPGLELAEMRAALAAPP